ncbi:hypothetical protein ACFL3B_03685 [Gemmatimonadota bacterium]
MHRAVIFVTVAVLLAPFPSLSAQQPPPLEPGVRVRLTAPDCGFNKHVGTLEALREDTLVFLGTSSQSSDPNTCLLASVRRFEVIQGRKSNVGKGIGYGSLVGGVVGSIVGSIDQASCTGWIIDCDSLPLFWAITLAVPGVFVGGIVGAFIKTDRWEEVPLDRLRVSFAPRREGFALGLSLSF